MLPPALVLGPPKFIAPLGVMRSLGRMGVSVHGLVHRGRSVAVASRYCAGTVSVGVNGRPIGDPQTLVGQLLDAGRILGRGTVLIPASDEWAALVARNATELRPTFTFAHNSPELVEALASKQSLATLAYEHRLPTPITFAPSSPEDAAALAPDLTYPVIVKPLESRPGMTMKALADDSAAMLTWFERMVESPDNPNVSIQQYIPGGDHDSWLFNGYLDADSRCLAAFTGTKLRQHPRRLGIASLVVTRHNAELIDQTVRFLAEIGYRGAVDIDYRYDARDGLYKVVDFNPRLGGAFRAFVDDSGMDVARALYLDLTGREVAVGRAVDGRRWMKEDADLIALRYYHKHEGLTIRGWLRSLRGVREGGTFARDDPMPFLVAMLQLFTRTTGHKLRRRGRVIGRAVRPALRRFTAREGA